MLVGEPRVRALENRRGILAMVLGMAFFLANDTLVKLASADLPTGQLICLRGLMACLWLLLMCAQRGLLTQWRSLREPVIWVRGAFDGLSSIAYLTALIHLPLANATAINLASPLFILVLAVIFLKERLQWVRTLAALVGFGGVLLIALMGYLLENVVMGRIEAVTIRRWGVQTER